jgi:hypothetical protein
LSGAVYTQTADVETECNGLLTYDRAVDKLDATMIATAIHSEREKHFLVLAPDALQGRVTWKYTTEKPSDDWVKPAFDDSKWSEGIGGFGTEGTPGTIINTVWNTNDIWLRREFTLNKEDFTSANIQLHHDEDAEVYLNGVLAAKAQGYLTTYEEVEPAPAALAVLQSGTNIMAVHCHQTHGGQYIDAGLVVPQPQSKTDPEK